MSKSAGKIKVELIGGPYNYHSVYLSGDTFEFRVYKNGVLWSGKYSYQKPGTGRAKWEPSSSNSKTHPIIS